MKLLILFAFVSTFAQARLVPGIYHVNTQKIPARGFFGFPEEGSAQWSKLEEKDHIWELSRTFIIPHREPCNAKEYAIMENRHTKAYRCVDKKTYEKSIRDEENIELEYNDLLEFMDAPFARPEDKNAAKALHLAFHKPSKWFLSGLTPPEGRLHYSSFWYDVRGPFFSVYKNGERTGYHTISKASELIPYHNYFIGSPLSPCDLEKDLTLYEENTGGSYVCLSTELFSKVMSTRLIVLSDIYKDRKGVGEKWVSGPDLVYCTASAAKEAAKLSQVGVVRKIITEFPGKGKLLLSVPPDPNSSGSLPPIRVYTYEHEEVSGYLVTYFGPLYGACQGYCKLQGYTVLMDENGKVQKFLDSTLAQTSIEYDISESGLGRITKLANNEGDKLTKLFQQGPAPSVEYSARMSQASLLWGAGNSVGTFLLHLSRVRSELGLTDWPLYDWSKRDQAK